MMKEKKTIMKKSTIKFLLPNNNYNYMINDEREKKRIKKKSQLNFYCLIIIIIKKTIKKKAQLNFYCLIIIIII